MTAETLLFSRPLVTEFQASMEPRSFDRGDTHMRTACSGLVALQWSRGLLTAETSPIVVIATMETRLQWSRGLLTAETFPPLFR